MPAYSLWWPGGRSSGELTELTAVDNAQVAQVYADAGQAWVLSV
jgi:hypothetical protein